MKAVLYNDFKFVKKLALPMVIFIGFILIIGFLITGEVFSKFFSQWTLTMIFIIRAQSVFGDNFKDFQKFMTMPVSIEDYSLAKIIKNLIIFVITSLVLLMGLILSHDEDKNIIIDIYTSLFIALDFLALSLSHIVFTRYQKRPVVFLCTLFWIIFGAGLSFIYSSFYKSFTIYRPIFIVVSIIICIFAFRLDYKYSTKYLRERGIL
uniref:Putative membrane protein n=1 Tax=Trichomonas vaginalis TaxID=5722 RepID=A0A024E1P6_TRIVA|nr:putative membrane protein [Trichomonas vaginalis]AHZ59508.1 putative membrane protein [Trichomonas vaginalis]AHZ59509.1 putative membrane protein [Trichomonas vaginalis]AHZ59510.1 putative membrane protein [Trichomonas vaginalis]AHZ59511.1 putative membrane protein [Trichomonas vaginalis]